MSPFLPLYITQWQNFDSLPCECRRWWWCSGVDVKVLIWYSVEKDISLCNSVWKESLILLRCRLVLKIIYFLPLSLRMRASFICCTEQALSPRSGQVEKWISHLCHFNSIGRTSSAAVWPLLGEGRRGLLRHVALWHKLNFKCHFKISKKSSLEVLEQKENFLRRNWLLFNPGPYRNGLLWQWWHGFTENLCIIGLVIVVLYILAGIWKAVCFDK